MKTHTHAIMLLLVSFASVLFTACQKDTFVLPIPTEDKPYYDEAYGMFDSIRVKTDLVAGLWQNNYYIMASGSAINMNNIHSLIAFSISNHSGLLSGEGTAVSIAFKSILANTKYAKLPEAIHHIIYDDNGNSLWLRINNITMSMVNPLVPVFNGESTVVGGTGKFTNSTGLVYFSGQLDIAHPSNSMIRNEGMVKY